ncbi:MAG: GNA1162 family protein, partial [Planctomycetota bacterium]
MRSLALLCVLAGSLLPSCAAPEPRYSAAFIERAPRSILVLPPLDESIETDGTYVTYAALTRPLLESGYYVFPPAVVDRLMRENGLPTPAEMHQAPLERLVDIFDPDAVLLVRITNWGTSYEVLQSVSRVGLEARLIDADTGALIWEDARLGQQGSGSGGGGIAG